MDGRGTPSESALVEFCVFFLSVGVDQVDFMGSILEPSELLGRIGLHCEDEVRAGRLLKSSYPLLRETLLAGEVERGRAPELTG